MRLFEDYSCPARYHNFADVCERLPSHGAEELANHAEYRAALHIPDEGAIQRGSP